MQAGIAGTIKVPAVFGDPTHRAFIHRPTLLKPTSTRSKSRARVRSSPASIARPRKTVAKPGPGRGARKRLPNAL
jgi:hypothetical protein